ncbi:MAG: hypothetical protein ACHREM_14915 [Polyangiales bacterium]
MDDPHLACAADAPKHAGDPCASATGCAPTPAAVTDASIVVNTYLTCDADAGVCVSVAPPVVPDFLGPCHVDLTGVEAGAYGYVGAPSCSGRLCLIAPSVGTPSCVAQGCTSPCAVDSDCPQGAICDRTLVDWLPGGGGGLSSGDVGVCKPGPPGAIGIGLACAG